jgi:hypothetical protein
MSKYVKSETELLNDLKNQIILINNSTKLYDSGCESEAINLATRIRVLVHSTSNSISLLSQLKKSDILFYDSVSTYESDDLMTQSSILIMKLDSRGAEYTAPLDNPAIGRKYRKRSFSNWWERVYIFKDKDGNLFSRKDIVLGVADTDGGAHIDPRLDRAYANLSRFNSLAWRYRTKDGDDKPLASPIPPAIRQIAHEVLKTLQDEFPDLFEEVIHATG